jgi:5'-nucleotidase
LKALAQALEAVGEVVVVAPDRERSAVGHAVTMTEPLRAWRERWPDGREVYVVGGTPADCVKIGLQALLPKRPDAVLSGINLGGNAGVNVIYSGTVSAATEATILGVPAAAVSLDTFTDPDFGPAARVAAWVAARILEEGLPPGVLLNVNVPAVPAAEIAGVRVTRQSGAVLEDRYEERRDPRGHRYFWLAAERMIGPDPHDDDDMTALRERYVSITPLHYDLTDEAARGELARWAGDFAW